MDNEEFYDKHIAPVLADLAKKCHERNMPFLTAVGDAKSIYSTIYVQDRQNPAVRLVLYALNARGNVDSLFMNVEKDAEKHGDNSMYLWQLRHYRKMIRGENKHDNNSHTG